MTAKELRHGGTMVTISKDGSTDIVRNGVRVAVYRSGQVVATWDADPERPALGWVQLDAGPDDPLVTLTLSSGESWTTDSGFQP